MDELKQEAHRQDMSLTSHKLRNEKLEGTLEHFKRHMQVREAPLCSYECVCVCV